MNTYNLMKNIIIKTNINKILIGVFIYPFILFLYLFLVLLEYPASGIASGLSTILIIFLLVLGFKSKTKGFLLLNGIIASFASIFYLFCFAEGSYYLLSYLFGQNYFQQSMISMDIEKKDFIFKIYTSFYFLSLILLFVSTYVAYHCLLNKELKKEYLIKDNVNSFYRRSFKTYTYFVIVIFILVLIYDINRFFF